MKIMKTGNACFYQNEADVYNFLWLYSLQLRLFWRIQSKSFGSLIYYIKKK
jgi:hypothetical protein